MLPPSGIALIAMILWQNHNTDVKIAEDRYQHVRVKKHLRQLCSCSNIGLCKETNVALAVVKVRAQHWLHIQVGITAVIDEPCYIAHVPCIQHILHLPANNTSMVQILDNATPDLKHCYIRSHILCTTCYWPPSPPTDAGFMHYGCIHI